MQSQSRAVGQKCRASRLGKLAPCDYDTIVRSQRNYIDWGRTIAYGSVCINLYLFGCKECARTRVHVDVFYTRIGSNPREVTPGKNPRAQSSKAHEASTLTRMAQQHHHDMVAPFNTCFSRLARSHSLSNLDSSQHTDVDYTKRTYPSTRM